ncbi:MAG: aldehyde ferredoxin oxidoreductase family protein [Chloroflexi bacterium]|nr:aldehyde ferredoxin oxidoreductase family protein [Chloroflexota bacterium]
MFGYHQRLLVVDLSHGRATVQPLTEATLRRFLGGVGLAAFLLDRECPAGADPFGPENPLILATSPLVGTNVTTSARFAVATRSPLTGLIGDSLSSSFLALEFKRAGVDALVIRGQAARPTYLTIRDGVVGFHDASHLMGKSPTATAAAIRAEQDNRALRVAAIGIAGERRVRFATISSDGRHAGRTGSGAVMGAKRLKAIAVEGTRPTPVAEPSRLKQAQARLIERSLGPATAKYRTLGTPANLLTFSRLGVLPTRNFQRSTFDAAEAVSGEQLYDRHLTRVVHCASCTVGCEHLYRTLAPPSDGASASQPPPPDDARLEYETLFALSSLLGIADLDLVIQAAARCDALGIDSISAGGTIAWAMECFERGLLTTRDTGGLELRFGNGATLLPLLDQIAHRTSLGEVLAEGSRRAAELLGAGSAAWAMHVKGLELPGYEPRGLKTMALGLAVSPRGACHNRLPVYEADFSPNLDRFRAEAARGALAAASEDSTAVLDSLMLCKFIRHCFDDFYRETADLLGLVTGWDVTADELRAAGERISNLRKRFNLRQGWTRADDTLPARLLDEPLSDGVGTGTHLTRDELDLMIAGYYQARGWRPDGTIPEERLRALGLDEASL